MPRPRSADMCGALHPKDGKVLRCGRARGHPGDHRHGKDSWARRITPEPPNSSGAAWLR